MFLTLRPKITWTDDKTENRLITTLFVNDEKVCDLKITLDENEWSIVAWYTSKDHLHKGYGFTTMQHAVRTLYKNSVPQTIKYIWNGANEYVMDWLKRHFTPVSMLPLAVQKYSEADDWESHIYVIDKDKFLEYFGVT